MLITGIAEEFAHGGSEWRQATAWQSSDVFNFLSSSPTSVPPTLLTKTALDWVAYVDFPPTVIMQSPTLVNGVFESAKNSRDDESIGKKYKEQQERMGRNVS